MKKNDVTVFTLVGGPEDGRQLAIEQPKLIIDITIEAELEELLAASVEIMTVGLAAVPDLQVARYRRVFGDQYVFEGYR